jgi:hypothetical protein
MKIHEIVIFKARTEASNLSWFLVSGPQFKLFCLSVTAVSFTEPHYRFTPNTTQ